MPYAKVIVNPTARGGETAKRWPLINELLEQNNLSFDYAFTEGVGHGIQLAREAADRDYELVVAVGGDGTVNEVVNGIIDGDGKGRATLGIICTGTGSDSIRTLGIPREYGRSCRALARHKRKRIDLGAAEYVSNGRNMKRYYINTAGLGFDAAVAERTTHFKRMGGTIPFLIGFATVFFTYKGKDVTINIDGSGHEECSLLIAVNNGCYFGGGMKIAPDADPCDGELDVITVRDTNKLQLLFNFHRLYKGTHTTHPKVSTYKAKYVGIETPYRLPLQLDGEPVGEAPATFRVVPKALNVAIGDSNG
ncbi:MAG: diacylglycerol kinase family protein [Chloroflexota bacterium]|nr:diacylglycerol kinase family protein [Chloroflexota bacterium]